MDELISGIRTAARAGELEKWFMSFAILVITAVVSYLLTRLVRKVLSIDGVPLPSCSLIVNIVRIAVWVIGVSLVLSACFDVDIDGLVAAIGIGGIALSLGLQDTISNFIGGLEVTLMRIIKPGDHVIIGQTEGIVQDITWRQTVVKDYENDIHVIPNSAINSHEIEKVEPHFLVSTKISFTNDTRDIDEVIREMEILAKKAVEKVAELEQDPWILLTQIGEYGTWAKLRFVLKDTSHAREARDAALRAVSPYTRVNSSEILHDSGAED